MEFETKEVPLSEIYAFSSGLSKPRSAFGSGFPFVGFKDVFYNTFVPEELSELVQTTEKERERCSVQRGDVFLTRTSETQDELGMSCVALRDYPDATFNGFTKRLRPKQNNPVLPEYAAYYFQSPRFRAQVNALSSMSTRASLNNEMLSSFTMRMPTLPEQERIARTLKSLDDRIALNHEMNQTLEDIARAIFKSWFIDHDPVHAKARGEPTGLPPEIDALFPSGFEESAYGPIPAGWTFCTFGEELGTLETGRRPKGGVGGIDDGVPSIGAQSITRIGEFDYSQTKFVPHEFFDAMRSGHLQSHDVLLYKDGGRPGEFKPHVSMFANGWPYQEMAINEHVFRMRGTHAAQEYLFCWLSSDPIMREMEDVGTGAAIPGITRTAVQGLPFVSPPQDIMDAWTAMVHPMFEKIFANCSQARTLSELRDSLLPKLISGDVQVPQEVVA